MLLAVLLELFCKVVLLLLTIQVSYTLTTEYINAVVEAGRAYLTIYELLYSQERLPLRI